MATSVVPFLGALPEGLVAHGQIKLAPPPEGHHHQPLLPDDMQYIKYIQHLMEYHVPSIFHTANTFQHIVVHALDTLP